MALQFGQLRWLYVEMKWILTIDTSGRDQIYEDTSEILSADSILLKKKERKWRNSEVLFTSKHWIDPINIKVH